MTISPRSWPVSRRVDWSSTTWRNPSRTPSPRTSPRSHPSWRSSFATSLCLSVPSLFSASTWERTWWVALYYQNSRVSIISESRCSDVLETRNESKKKKNETNKHTAKAFEYQRLLDVFRAIRIDRIDRGAVEIRISALDRRFSALRCCYIAQRLSVEIIIRSARQRGTNGIYVGIFRWIILCLKEHMMNLSDTSDILGVRACGVGYHEEETSWSISRQPRQRKVSPLSHTCQKFAFGVFGLFPFIRFSIYVYIHRTARAPVIASIARSTF